MWWFTFDTDLFESAIIEISKQHDRAAAIMATSILEEHLFEAIKLKLQRDEKIEARLFLHNGPLSSFASRIDLGCLLGIYDQQYCTRIHLIRRIRNEFAHRMEPTTFKTQKHKCLQLKAKKGSFQDMQKSLRELNVPAPPSLLTMFRMTTNPRTQFLRAVQIHVSHLTLMIAIERQKLNGLPTVKLSAFKFLRRRRRRGVARIDRN